MPSRTFTRVNLAIILSLVISLMPTPQTTGAAVAAAKPDRLWATLPGTSALPDWFGDQSSADQSTRASSQTAGRKAVWLPPVGPVDLALGETIRPAADELSAVHERVEARTSAALLTGDPWPPSGYSSSVWAGTNNAGAWFWDGSWHQRSGGDLGTSADVNDIAVSPFNHDVVVAATDDGIYITTTTQSWVSVTLPSGFTDASWNAVRWDAHTPGVVFATGYDQSGPSGYRDKPIWARSADNGTTWTGGHLDEGSTWRWELYIKEGTDVWGAGERWYIGADAMGSGDYYKRYWRSQDGGGSWEADLIDIDEAAWLNNEKWVAGRLGDAERVYVAPYIGGYYSEPLAHSSDGGDTWNEEDSPGSWPRHLEYDPTRPNNLWAAYEDGVIRSTDDAVSFSTAYTNTTELRSLAIDGYTGRIYAGGLAGGAFDDFIYWDEGDTSWTEPGKIPSPADSSTTIWALSAPQPPYLDDAMLANQECPFCTAYDAHNHAGDPIDTRNGSFTHNQPAFSLPVLGGALDFRLTYVSQAADVYTTTMGYGWTHNQEVGLSFPYGITGPVVLQGHGGSRLVFGNDGDGTFSPTPGLRAALTRLGATSPHTYVITATTQHVYTFDDDGLPLSIQDPQGNVTTYEHDASDRLESVIGPSSDTSEERILTFSYDAQDRLTGVSGLLSGTTALSYSVSLGYDASGDLNVFTDTRGLAWTYTYIGSHLLQKITDPNANDVMQNVYDDRDRVVEQEDPLGESLYLEYTLADTTIVTDALGRVTVDSYDERGTWAGTTLPDSNVITRSYDANLNLGLSVDAAGNETSYDWSSGGYDLETVTDAMGEETQFDYDARHNLIEAVNARGYTTTYEYDSSNNPITVTDALEGVTSNTYDNYGNLLSTTDPRGHTTSYAYNAFGQRTAITDTLGFVTRFEYDALGRLITTTQRADDGSELNVTVNAYDLGDNLTQVTESYTSATTTQNYGGLWNLVTAYGYDGVGNQTSMTDTLGRVTLTEYDAADRADKVTRNYTSAGGVDYQSTYNLVTRYTYDAVGNRVDEIDTVAW
jgi:YD repeat-containing protein